MVDAITVVAMVASASVEVVMVVEIVATVTVLVGTTVLVGKMMVTLMVTMIEVVVMVAVVIGAMYISDSVVLCGAVRFEKRVAGYQWKKWVLGSAKVMSVGCYHNN